MSRPRLRTPKDIDAAARWTSRPVNGWKYWFATATVLLVAWVLPERWVIVTTVVLVVGLWLRNRYLASPGLDKEAPTDEQRGTLPSSAP